MTARKGFYTAAFALFLFVLGVAPAVSAQNQPLRLPRPSQKATVTQTVGITDVTIVYSRPAVRGRRIWGDPPAQSASGASTLDDARTRAADAAIVPYGHVWRTGANEATQFTVTDDVLINGQPLPAGSYSLHTIPGRDEWTIIFNKVADQWGSFNYDEKQDALRVRVKPQQAAEMQEWLRFDIDPASQNSAQVNIRWEKLRVPFTVEVRDVNALVMSKVRAALANARPDNWQVRLQAASFALQNRINTDEAMQWLDESIKIKETFGNLSTKARVLASQGKTQEAITMGERAIQLGREAKANPEVLGEFEQQVANWKAGKK